MQELLSHQFAARKRLQFKLFRGSFSGLPDVTCRAWMSSFSRELAALGFNMSSPAAPDGSTADEGVSYGKSFLFDVVSHSVLKSLDPKDMTRSLSTREEYELKVEEKREDPPPMNFASFILCSKRHVLRSMHFTGMLEKVTANVPLADLTSDHIKQSIEEAIDLFRMKEPEARVAEAVLDGLRMQLSIENPRTRVKKQVTDYLEHMEDIGHGSFKDDSPKETVAHLT